MYVSKADIKVNILQNIWSAVAGRYSNWPIELTIDYGVDIYQLRAMS